MSSEQDQGLNPYASPESTGAPTPSDEAMGVTPRAIEHLAGTKPWVRFLSVLGFLAGVLLLIAGVGFLGGTGPAEGFGPGVAIVYAFMGFIYFVLSYFLFKYANAIGELLMTGQVEWLEDALRWQKSFWRVVGILALAVLLINVILLVFMWFPSFR